MELTFDPATNSNPPRYPTRFFQRIDWNGHEITRILEKCIKYIKVLIQLFLSIFLREEPQVPFAVQKSKLVGLQGLARRKPPTRVFRNFHRIQASSPVS